MTPWKRRRFGGALLGLAGAAIGGVARGEERDGTGQRPVRYPDPDVVALDKRFEKYKIGNTAIQRLYTGMLCEEGPAWSAAGRYLLWRDIPNDVQLRRLGDDGHVSVFRSPSGNAKGNMFDFEGAKSAANTPTDVSCVTSTTA